MGQETDHPSAAEKRGWMSAGPGSGGRRRQVCPAQGPRAEARSQEAQARTKMLQNLAAQKNLSLASIDAVKENIASTLGTDVSNITFQSITLDDRKPGEGKPWDPKPGKKERKENLRGTKEENSRQKAGKTAGRPAARTSGGTERRAGRPDRGHAPETGRQPSGNGQGSSCRHLPWSVPGPV